MLRLQNVVSRFLHRISSALSIVHRLRQYHYQQTMVSFCANTTYGEQKTIDVFTNVAIRRRERLDFIKNENLT
ncbi:hypothetical protein QR680_011161 [Steinernema hermaphroditum]|uniref:Uncharacterized protein n=1 Tax=Steinernema hermaphroditum TaxID=289476 RepID=A0AA39IRB0_9BILA|nr:hypothetical protein QR680_011161 [Steinernema hermaphroditum]